MFNSISVVRILISSMSLDFFISKYNTNPGYSNVIERPKGTHLTRVRWNLSTPVSNETSFETPLDEMSDQANNLSSLMET